MREGIIVKALQRNYYVRTGGTAGVQGQGPFPAGRHLASVGDRVRLQCGPRRAREDRHVEERKNFFIRPAVSNIDPLVILASGM